MSDFFKRMKSVFVESSEVSDESKEAFTKETTEGTTTDPNQKQTYIPNNSSNIAIAGKHSDQFYKVLFDAMEQTNQPGFDYLEFKKALIALESISMDEKTKYLSAFAGAQASGASKTSLLDTGKHYLNALEKELNNFNNAVQQQWQKQIGNRENEIKQLNNLIAGKKEQIQKLEAEMKDHHEMLTSLEQEIQDSQTKIETTKVDFQATYQALVDKIHADLDRINTYITNP